MPSNSGTFYNQPATPLATLTGANNGVSLSGGNVVLGNDAGGTAAQLLSTREIPLNSFQVNFVNGTAFFASIRPSGQFVAVAPASGVAVRVNNPTDNITSDFLNTSIGGGLHIKMIQRGLFMFNDSNPLSGNVRVGSWPSLVSQNNGATLQVAGPTTTDYFVQAQTTSPLAVNTNNDKDKVFTNEGAAGTIQFQLPAPLIFINGGQRFTFEVVTAQTVNVLASGASSIRVGGISTAVGGSVSSSIVGSSITIQALNSSQYRVISYVGTWQIN